MEIATIAVLVGAGLHLFFAFGEIVPLSDGKPLIMGKVLKKRNIDFSDEEQRKLVVTIVQNAGIYNLILGVGFLWSAFPIGFGGELDPSAVKAIRVFFLSAAVVAGLFGLTLSRLTIVQAIVQAIVGFVGLGIVLST